MSTSIRNIRDTDAQDERLEPSELAMHRRRRWAARLGALGLALLVGWMLLRMTDDSLSVSKGEIRITTVVVGPVMKDVLADGLVVAAESRPVFTPSTGQIELEVSAGDRVNQGQTIAIIRNPPLETQLRIEEAALKSLQLEVARNRVEIEKQRLVLEMEAHQRAADLESAARELERAEFAWATRSISERDYRKAKDDHSAAARASTFGMPIVDLELKSLQLHREARSLDEARQTALVESLRQQFSELTVRAPISGTIGSVAVPDRSVVEKHKALLSVVDLSRLEVEFMVPEAYVDEIHIGMPAEVIAGELKHAGNVSAVSPEIVNNQGIGRIRFDSKSVAGLRQNQRVTTRIVLESRKNALKYSLRGTDDRPGAGHAYRLDGDTATRVPVVRGIVGMSDVEILEGLAAGDQIVTVLDRNRVRDAQTFRVDGRAKSPGGS